MVRTPAIRRINGRVSRIPDLARQYNRLGTQTLAEANAVYKAQLEVVQDKFKSLWSAYHMVDVDETKSPEARRICREQANEICILNRDFNQIIINHLGWRQNLDRWHFRGISKLTTLANAHSALARLIDTFNNRLDALKVFERNSERELIRQRLYGNFLVDLPPSIRTPSEIRTPSIRSPSEPQTPLRSGEETSETEEEQPESRPDSRDPPAMIKDDRYFPTVNKERASELGIFLANLWFRRGDVDMRTEWNLGVFKMIDIEGYRLWQGNAVPLTGAMTGEREVFAQYLDGERLVRRAMRFVPFEHEPFHLEHDVIYEEEGRQFDAYLNQFVTECPWLIPRFLALRTNLDECNKAMAYLLHAPVEVLSSHDEHIPRFCEGYRPKYDFWAALTNPNERTFNEVVALQTLEDQVSEIEPQEESPSEFLDGDEESLSNFLDGDEEEELAPQTPPQVRREPVDRR